MDIQVIWRACKSYMYRHTDRHNWGRYLKYVISYLLLLSNVIYVTGFWKTDRNVTLGQLHFLGPANSHTHTLSMHCCNTRLSCLVCFSRADFADHVKPRLGQWDPWRALDGRYGSDIHP